MISGLSYWALLPLRVSLVGTHPVVAELLNGSIEAIISAAAFAGPGTERWRWCCSRRFPG